MAQDFDDLFDAPAEIPRTIAAAYLGGLKVAVSDLLVHRVASGVAKNLDNSALADRARKATKAVLSSSTEAGARKSGRVRDALKLEIAQRRNTGMGKAAADEAVPAQEPAAPAATAEEQAMAEMAPGGVEEAPVPGDLMGASPEELSLHLAELVSHEFKMHQWYTYYAEMIRGTDRGGLVELFEELAPLELEDGKYFARRLSVLGPGTVIPVTPNPEPLQDPMQIADKMLQEEQRAVMLLQNFHGLCGEDPMRFQVEQMMADEQVHADRLQQFMAAAQAAAPKKTKSEKIAAAVQAVKQELVAQPAEQEQAQQLAIGELQAQNAQLTQERAALSERLQGVSQMAQQHMQSAQDAAMMQQQLGDESAAAQEEAMMAQEQAQASMQEAADHAQVAAMEADAKMRLGIRIQQMRQRLSEIVTEDPVAEEGADMPAIPTSTQQAGMMDPSMQDPMAGGDPAAQDPAAAGAEGGAPAAPPAEATSEPSEPSAKPKPKDSKSKPKSDSDDAKVEVKVGSLAQVLNRGAKTLGNKAVAGASRVGELATGSKANKLRAASADHLSEAKSWAGRAASDRAKASDPAMHSGQKAMHLIGAQSAERSEGQAIKRHWDTSAAHKKEQQKVKLTRTALGGVGLGGAAGAGGSEPKTAGVLDRVVSRLHGAGKKLEGKAKDHVVQRGKEVVREIADTPEMKQRLERVARDAGHQAVDQASKHPAIATAKKGLERGAKQLAGVTAGSAAVSTGTSIYQGNKTRKAIKEHGHGK